jgi:hypothetical protein
MDVAGAYNHRDQPIEQMPNRHLARAGTLPPLYGFEESTAAVPLVGASSSRATSE